MPDPRLPLTITAIPGGLAIDDAKALAGDVARALTDVWRGDD